MKTPLLIFLIAALCGCSSVKIEQDDTSADGSSRHTRFRARTTWDAKSALTKLRTTMTDKSQGVGIAGLDQESSGSNVVAIAGAVTEAAVKAAIKSAVPVP